MKALKKALQLFLMKVYGLTEEEATSLLNKDEEGNTNEEFVAPNLNDKLLDLDKARVAKLKGKEGEENELFKQGFNKAKKEVLTKLENELREKYDVTDDKLTGAALVEAIVTEKAKPNVQNAKDINEEVLKAHPAYIALEKAKIKAEKDAQALAKTEVEKVQKQYERKEVLSTIKSEALNKFLALNPVLAKNATVAENQKRKFVDLFDSYDYEKQTDGTYLIMVGEGDARKRLEDGHGNPLKLDDLVKQEASNYYEFAVQQPKGSAGNGGAGGGGGADDKKYEFKVPTNEDEYNDAIFNAKNVEERQAIDKAWTENKPATV